MKAFFINSKQDNFKLIFNQEFLLQYLLVQWLFLEYYVTMLGTLHEKMAWGKFETACKRLPHTTVN